MESSYSDSIAQKKSENQFLSYLEKMGYSTQDICDTYFFVIRSNDCLGCSQMLHELLLQIEENGSDIVLILLENHKNAIKNIKLTFKHLVITDSNYIYFDFGFSKITPYYYFFSSDCSLKLSGLVSDFKFD
jgi:hypothetical protein